MTIACTNCPLRKFDIFDEMTQDELDFMQTFKVGELVVEPGAPLLMEGSNSPQLYTVLSGLGLRYKLTPDGDRQVINFVFPGDFLGLQAGVMSEMGHSVEATTRMTLCVFDRTHFWQVYTEMPRRAYDLTWLAAVEEHFLGESMVALGRRDATASVAWALVRVAQRMEALNLVTGGAMAFPYRQQDLADALGLSLVHTNKTLARLRERQLATWSEGTLTVHDMIGLAEVGQVDIESPPVRPLM